jgi:hypothetical protein
MAVSAADHNLIKPHKKIKGKEKVYPRKAMKAQMGSKSKVKFALEES